MENIPIFSNLKTKLTTNGELENFSSRFSDTSNGDEERVEMTLKYLQQYHLLPFDKTDTLSPRKCAKVSADLRNAGNRSFMKDNQQALVMYSKSIAMTPYPTSSNEQSEDLAFNFANRSAVYFVMKKYGACVKDIDHALSFQYPDRLRYKLLERRGMCCKELGRSDQALWSFQEALKYVPSATYLSSEKMKSVIGSLECLSLDVTCELQDECNNSDEIKPLPKKSFGQHPKMPCAADCLDIKYSENVGRHVVANKDIDPGDILFVEEPFTSVVLPEFCLTHCNKCLKRSDAMIPCTVCELAMYCSPACREASWTLSHKVECWLVPALQRLDVGESSIFLLPLRILLVACCQAGGLSDLYEAVTTSEDRNSPQTTQDFQTDAQYNSFSYKQMHDLLHHVIEDVDFQLAWAVGVASIVNCFESYSDFFRSDPHHLDNERTSRLKLFTGGLLLKYIGIVSTNCFSVTEWVTSKSDRQVNEVTFGNALYLTVSLINHSCYPNALNSFHHGDVHAVTAKRPIKKGDEIVVCYGGSFTHSEYSERRLELRMNYCFDCQCIACSNLWPTFKDLQPMTCPEIVCQQCRTTLPDTLTDDTASLVTCLSCGHTHDYTRLRAQTTKLLNRVIYIYNEIKSGSPKNHTAELAAAVTFLDLIVKSPCQLTAVCQQYLRYSMKVSGNIFIEQ